MYWKVLLPVILICASIPAFCQVDAAAERPGLPLSIGAGYSNFNSDWLDRIGGTTVWADWSFYRLPSHLNGLGIEAEGRDLRFHSPQAPPNLRYDTLGGGPIYKWRHFRNAYPYAKLFLGIGSIDFTYGPGYSHDTRTVYAPGGGLEYHVWRAIWGRVDYEYQFWPDFIHHHTLNPSGFTIGASYDFHTRW
jgi:hypothetical protein